MLTNPHNHLWEVCMRYGLPTVRCILFSATRVFWRGLSNSFWAKIEIFGDIYNKTYLISFLVLMKSRKNRRTVDFRSGSLNKAWDVPVNSVICRRQRRWPVRSGKWGRAKRDEGLRAVWRKMRIKIPLKKSVLKTFRDLWKKSQRLRIPEIFVRPRWRWKHWISAPNSQLNGNQARKYRAGGEIIPENIGGPRWYSAFSTSTWSLKNLGIRKRWEFFSEVPERF